MKDETDHFPGDKCYIFDQVNDFYCASYESVRAPGPEEIKALFGKNSAKNR
jgi:hypothetical protein